MEKQIIIDFLEKSGFKEKGRDTYKREGTGTIFIREWSAIKVMWQIMELGEKHHANKLRDLLKISDQVETYIFNPQV
jgi:hypothetical protein